MYKVNEAKQQRKVNMTADIRVYYGSEEHRERVKRWAQAINLKPTAAINKLVLDTVANWEKENSIDND